MNQVAEEIRAYYGAASSNDDDIMHYGMPRRSGRYPYGSGEDPYQHGSRDFLGRVEEMRKAGFTYTDENGKTWTGDNAIAKSMGLNSTQFRTEIGIAKDERRMLQVETAKRLRDKEGLGASEIGRKMGINESSVRSLLNAESESRMLKSRETANHLKKLVDEKGMIDVSGGSERELRISKEKLDQALYLLQREGYEVYGGRFEQATNPGKMTTQRVLCPPGTQHKDIYKLDQIHSINEDNWISRDGGETFVKKFQYPASMDSKRLQVRYAEQGGVDMDGVVQLRPNVPDLSLGESRYSQVRIMVDNTHYIKGMAVYGDPKDFPPGVDVIFNTNKKLGTPLTKVLKEIKKDPDNPFGSLIKDADQGGQYEYTDPKTGKKKLGLINKRADEGDWTEWADALPSQFLSKQSTAMAKKQLDLAKINKQAEYDDICALTNPTIKKHLLEKFADGCDSAAKDLKAAALPGQKYHVILPNNTLKETEIYAPGYENGSKLALIRYPHGGTFEIPILTVNNKNALGKKLIGTDSMDAVCINKKVADRLSGADFDGDTVMCIPTHDKAGKVKVTSTKPLPELEGFDSKSYQYADVKIDSNGNKHYYDATGREFKAMTKKGTQIEMGKISNLITDMTLIGASREDLAKAVKHSMVVIDANKHGLDYKKSEIDNDIKRLIKDYRSWVDENGVEHTTKGANTIVSKAKGQESVDKRQGTPHINQKGKEWYDPSKPEGALVYKTADDLYYPIRNYDKKTHVVTLTTTNGKKITYSMDNPDDVAKYEPVATVKGKGGKNYFDSVITNRDGTISYKVGKRGQQSTKMDEHTDAMELVSKARHPMELLYADYANSMKSLANQARMELVSTGKIKYNASAKKTYQAEVSSLMEKLNDAELNRAKERAAQRRTMASVYAKKEAYKKENGQEMDWSDEKKLRQQTISRARDEVGSIRRRDRNIKITDREWEAIQAGAISETQLKKILDNTDTAALRERATPRTNNATISSAKSASIKAMANSNYTLEQIAKKYNLSTSTVSKYLRGVD